MDADSITPVLVLLPKCVESNEDVFLSILKNVVSRKKFEDNYLRGFKTGMASEQFDIGSDDMSVNWKMLNSRVQRIWQSKLIGFWCSKNYPLIGKKLFGEGWEAPIRKNVVSKGMLIKADDVDTIVFQKISLRLVELNVIASTTDRLKWLVKAPSSIDFFNPVKLTKKMRSFSIRDGHLDICWKALKIGEFSTTDAASTFTLPESRSETMDNDINHDDLAVNENSKSNVSTDSDNPSLSTKALQFSCRFRKMYQQFWRKTVFCVISSVVLVIFVSSVATFIIPRHPPKRTRVDYVVCGDLSAGSDEMMTEIRDNVRDLRNWFDPAHINAMNELKKKDLEVAKANISMFEITEKNAALETELEEARQALINEKKQSETVEKMRAETMKNIAKLEDDVNRWTVNAASKEREVEALLAEKKSLEEAEGLKVERIAKLEDDVNRWTVYAAHKEKEVEALSVEKRSFEEAERIKAGMSEQIAKLEIYLNSWAAYAANKEKEVEVLVTDKKKIEEAERKKSEWIAKLEFDLSGWTVYATSKEEEVKALVAEKKAFEDLLKEKEEKLRASSVNYKKLEQDFLLFKSDIGTVLPNLQSQILELENGLSQGEEQQTIEDQNIIERESRDITERKDPDTTDNEVFESDDPIVKESRPILLTVPFGWIKFESGEACKPCPGFVFPDSPDSDGNAQAQKITPKGYMAKTKSIFYEYRKNVPDTEKEKSQVAKLKLFNKKFGFKFE